LQYMIAGENRVKQLVQCPFRSKLYLNTVCDKPMLCLAEEAGLAPFSTGFTSHYYCIAYDTVFELTIVRTCLAL